MELRILGSGTCFPSTERRCAGYLLKTKGKTFLIDAGPGTHTSLYEIGIDFRSIDEIFITHFHVDHVNDLSAILFTHKHAGKERPERLPVIHGPKGFSEDFKKLMDTYGTQIVSEGHSFMIVEHSMENPYYKLGAIQITGLDLEHSVPTIGYRFEYEITEGEEKADEDSVNKFSFEEIQASAKKEENAVHGKGKKNIDEEDEEPKAPIPYIDPDRPVKAFAYSGDTSPCPNLHDLSRNSDCLLMEVSSDSNDPKAGHSTIEEAADLAAKADVKILVLTHITPENDIRNLEKIARSTYGGMIIRAKDGMRLTI